MNLGLISNFNNIVTNEDDVYVLGDLFLNNNEQGIQCVRELHGNLHIVLGNHDTINRQNLYLECPNIIEVCAAKYLKYKKYSFFLSHFPALTANSNDQKSFKEKIINLCGHTHTDNPFLDWDKGVIYHVEVDAHNNKPISIDEVITNIKSKGEFIK